LVTRLDSDAIDESLISEGMAQRIGPQSSTTKIIPRRKENHVRVGVIEAGAARCSVAGLKLV